MKMVEIEQKKVLQKKQFLCFRSFLQLWRKLFTPKTIIPLFPVIRWILAESVNRTPTADGTSRLEVASPDVNFLRKVMSSSRHDGAAYSRHPCRQSADADIVSAFPLSFSTFLENINILRQTSSTWHRILREFCVLESFQKTSSPAKGYQFHKKILILLYL